jgi:hypothetical protein
MAIEVCTLSQFLESEEVVDRDCSIYWASTHGPFKLEILMPPDCVVTAD